MWRLEHVTSDPAQLTWGPIKNRKDIDIVNVKYILLGPLEPESGKTFFRLPDVEATALFETFKKGVTN